MFGVFHLEFADYLSADGVTRAGYRVAITGDQRVPFGQILPLCQQPVGAGGRQPVGIFEYRRCDTDAIGHIDRAVGVVTAATARLIQITATDVGEDDLSRAVILESLEAALRASVTEDLPLFPGEGVKRLGKPEWARPEGVLLSHAGRSKKPKERGDFAINHCSILLTSGVFFVLCTWERRPLKY